MARQMNNYWQNVRKECGQWSWDGYLGNKDHPNCANANTELQTYAYFVLPDGRQANVTRQLTNSVSSGLWSNTVLRE